MGLFSKKVKIRGVIPTGKVLYRFRALTDFWSDKLQSQYVKNGLYSVREGNSKLATLVAEWVAQDKVEVL